MRPLNELIQRLYPRGAGQFPQFGHGIFGVLTGAARGDRNQYGALQGVSAPAGAAIDSIQVRFQFGDEMDAVQVNAFQWGDRPGGGGSTALVAR